jgi:hypothetical protein
MKGRFGDRHISALLLFNHHRHELDVRPRLGGAKVMVEGDGGSLRELTSRLVLPRTTIHAIR